jgi:NAD(P)H-flavin reductase
MTSRATVAAAWDEGPLLRAVRLEPTLPPYRAGQALRVLHPAGAAYFALATAYGETRAPELLLRRGGGVAEALIADARPGASFEFEGPGGPGFPLHHARGRDVLLVAAGAGISAIRSVIEELVDEREAFGKISLFYGQERAEEFAYPDARASWAASQVSITLCAHSPDEGWAGARGFVQDAIVATDLGVDPHHAVAYLCGMSGMIAGVRQALAPLGLPESRTYLNL